MAHDPVIAVRDVLDEIAFLKTLSVGTTIEDFRTNPIAFRAAAYSIQIILEAVRRIPEEWLGEFPNEPWSAIKATGNKIRHEYYRLDEAILWRIMTLDTTALEVVMKKILERRTAS